jgi:hypothetical protein
MPSAALALVKPASRNAANIERAQGKCAGMMSNPHNDNFCHQVTHRACEAS